MKQLHKRIADLKLRQAGQYVASSFKTHTGKMEYRIKANEDNTAEGYLAVWDIPDDAGTFPIKGAFSKSLRERGPQSQAKQKILFLWMHDMCNAIGQFVELEEDDYGLRFKVAIDDIPEGRRFLAQVRSGTLNQFSYGFLYVWDKMEYIEERDAIMMKEVDLWEGSAVFYGSQSETFAIRSKEQLTASKEDAAEELEELLRTLPKVKQMELRQLLTRMKSLDEIKPDSLLSSLKSDEAGKTLAIGGYKFDVEQFKN